MGPHTTALPANGSHPAGDPAQGRQTTGSSSLPDRRRWYVVHAQPKAEARAIANLRRQEFEVFCPSQRRTVRHARKTTVVLSPLFPSYIFVQIDREADRWRSINGTRGVIRLITNGDEPTPVPYGIVEELQLRMGEDGAMTPSVAFKKGDRVVISDGPFAELIGTLEHLNAAGRVQVLLDLLGRTVRVSVKDDVIAPAG